MSSNETPRRPVQTQSQVTRGSPRTLVASVAAISAGLGLFWYMQKWNHRQKQEDVLPGQIPTWEYRLQQRNTPEANASDPLVQRVSGSEPVSRPKDIPLPGNDSAETGSGALTAAHGKGSDKTQESSEHVDEPPQMGRTNDKGDQAYSKHSEYTDTAQPDRK